MVAKRQSSTACHDMGNGYPICSPKPTDTWIEGSQYQFVWNYNYPFYVTSSQLDLHLYYRENYAYQEIKKWTNITTTDESFTVTVDSSWFPTSSSTNVTWTMFGYYLPAGMNDTQQLVDVYSMYPRPFNFSVIQIGSPSSANSPKNSNTADSGDSNNSNGSGSLPSWAIAVIAVACVLFAVALAALLWGLLYARRRKQRNKLLPAAAATASRVNGGGMTQPKPLYDGSSIHSSTPIIAAAAGGAAATSSNRNSDSIRNSTAGSSRPYSPDTSPVMSKAAPLSLNNPSADSYRNLLRNTAWQDELRRQQLGDEILQRELNEEGASVRHAEHRPLTVTTEAVPDIESRAVVLESQADSAAASSNNDNS